MQFDPHQWADTPVVRLVCFEPKEADMTTTSRTSLRAMSRRTILVQSAGCAAGAAGLLLPLKEAVAKMSQKSVAYQDSPKDDQKCSNCSLFLEPNACTLIDGDVSPQGWCKFWVKKPG
jgi:High potential iron-sulfur protein